MTDLIIFLGLTTLGIIILYPFYNSVLVSLTPQHVYVKNPLLIWPKEITLNAYKFVFSNSQLLQGLKVTTIITILGVTYNMFLTVCMAYVLTKPVPGRKIMFYAIIFTMYFKGGLIPFYLVVRGLGLMDTIWAMILPSGIVIFYMVVIKRFFEEIPEELSESARIDGANDITILFKIILPLSLPVLATFSLYYGVQRWNEWWFGMLFIKSVDKQPLQLVLRKIIQDASSLAVELPTSIQFEVYSEGLKMASIVVTMVPIMCLYPFLQKYFVKGLSVGAVKG